MSKMLTLVVLLCLAGNAAAAPKAKKAAKGSPVGKERQGVMPDAKGMTLYTFDKDEAGKSNCAGPCAKNWPPLMAGADAKDAGDWTLVAREDGKQWAYKGKPVYRWSQDKKPGDKTGDGFKDVWDAAKP